MSIKPKSGSTIKVRRFSKLPTNLGTENEVYLPRPDMFVGDGTAFAFYPPENSAMMSIRGSVMFASNRRDPIEDDTVLVSLKSGGSVLRTIFKIEHDKYHLVKIVGKKDGQVECSIEQIEFSDIEAISVVLMTQVI